MLTATPAVTGPDGVHTNICRHTHTHSQAQTYTRTNADTLTLTDKHTHKHRHTHTRTNTGTHVHAWMHASLGALTWTQAQSYVNIRTQRTYTHAYTHVYTVYTHGYTHTHRERKMCFHPRKQDAWIVPLNACPLWTPAHSRPWAGVCVYVCVYMCVCLCVLYH